MEKERQLWEETVITNHLQNHKIKFLNSSYIYFIFKKYSPFNAFLYHMCYAVPKFWFLNSEGIIEKILMRWKKIFMHFMIKI